MGDMNYRMKCEPDEMVALVADSARLMQSEVEAEEAACGSGIHVSWRRRCYAQMLSLRSAAGGLRPPLIRNHRSRNLHPSWRVPSASKTIADDDDEDDDEVNANDAHTDVPAPPLAVLRAQSSNSSASAPVTSSFLAGVDLPKGPPLSARNVSMTMTRWGGGGWIRLRWKYLPAARSLTYMYTHTHPATASPPPSPTATRKTPRRLCMGWAPPCPYGSVRVRAGRASRLIQ